MEIKDFIIAYLSVPLSDEGIPKVLNDKTIQWRLNRLNEWIANVLTFNPRISINKQTQIGENYLILSVVKPIHRKIGFLLVDERELVNAPFEVNKIISFKNANNLDGVAVLLAGDAESEKVKLATKSILDVVYRLQLSYCVVFEPEWTSAILVENMIPFCHQTGSSQSSFEPTAFFQRDLFNEDHKLYIHRAEDRLQFLMDSVSPESVKPYTSKMYKGTTLLCSTFLPHLTYSLKAVERFYTNFGVTDSICKKLLANIQNDRNHWKESILKFKRYDIIDRGQLEEYIAAPDYYQMQLNQEELAEQIENLIGLLNYDNYALCLTSEAVDLAFEIQKPSIRIRTDRRNRARPRVGRINRIEFIDEKICDTFEREFWNKFRLTEADFKDKSFIIKWLKETLNNRTKSNADMAEMSGEYDVFISYNSKDRAEVLEIVELLQAKGIQPWIDIYDARPGVPWIKTLEAQIEKIRSCVVFMGKSGLGPWEDMEQMSFITQFVKRNSPVIPVILKGINADKISFPPILNLFSMVDMNVEKPDPLDRLAFGIKGKK